MARQVHQVSPLCASFSFFSDSSFFLLRVLKYEIQLAGDEYLSKTKLNREYSCFLKELQIPAVASIRQTERNGIKLVAACIKEGMWHESHSLALLLPLQAVTNLDYRMHLRTKRILTPLESFRGGC